jgi:HEAT repeat protein
MSLPLELYLEELRDPGKPLVMAKLANLSDLSPEEAESFDGGWLDIDVERRRQIVARLADLLEYNLELDFDAVLRSCLADPDGAVRALAAEALGASDDRHLIEPLTGLLAEDEDVAVRASAAGALGKLAMLAALGKLPEDDAARVEAALLAAFRVEGEELDVRCRVLEAISPLGRPEVEEMIRQAYRSDSLEFQVSAVYAMGRNCNPGWLPLLLKELRSPNAQLRYEAVRACAELEAEEAVHHLVELTRDDDAEVQVAAIEALGEIGGDEAREFLEECLKAESDSVREAAQDALDEIGFWDDPSSM